MMPRGSAWRSSAELLALRSPYKRQTSTGGGGARRPSNSLIDVGSWHPGRRCPVESTWLSRARSAALCSAKPRLEAAIGPSKSSLRVKVLQRHLAGLAGGWWCSIGFRVLGLGFRDSCASGRTRTRTRRGKTVPSPWASRHRASPSQLCRALALSRSFPKDGKADPRSPRR